MIRFLPVLLYRQMQISNRAVRNKDGYPFYFFDKVKPIKPNKKKGRPKVKFETA